MHAVRSFWHCVSQTNKASLDLIAQTLAQCFVIFSKVEASLFLKLSTHDQLIEKCSETHEHRNVHLEINVTLGVMMLLFKPCRVLDMLMPRNEDVFFQVKQFVFVTCCFHQMNISSVWWSLQVAQLRALSMDCCNELKHHVLGIPLASGDRSLLAKPLLAAQSTKSGEDAGATLMNAITFINLLCARQWIKSFFQTLHGFSPQAFFLVLIVWGSCILSCSHQPLHVMFLSRITCCSSWWRQIATFPELFSPADRQFSHIIYLDQAKTPHASHKMLFLLRKCFSKYECEGFSCN